MHQIANYGILFAGPINRIPHSNPTRARVPIPYLDRTCSSASSASLKVYKRFELNVAHQRRGNCLVILQKDSCLLQNCYLYCLLPVQLVCRRISRSNCVSIANMIRNSRQYWLQVLAVGFIIATSIYVLTGEVTSNLRASLGITSDAKLPNGPRPGHGDSTTDSAGNSTLGFDAVYFINMATRYDRLDALSLQAYLSGIDITLSSGVSSDMMHDVGMPPTHTPGLLGDGQKGCWRAHANVSFFAVLIAPLYSHD